MRSSPASRRFTSFTLPSASTATPAGAATAWPTGAAADASFAAGSAWRPARWTAREIGTSLRSTQRWWLYTSGREQYAE